MTDFEILSLVFEAIGLLISSNILVVTLLSFLDKRKSKRK